MTENCREQLTQAAAALEPIFPAPRELDARTREVADAAVEGTVITHYLGDQHLEMGRTHCRWTTVHDDVQVLALTFRTEFILQLATAFALTGEEDYARAACDYLEDYMASWPLSRIGQHERADSTLDMARRNVCWAQSLPLLAEAECFPEERLSRIVDYMAGQLSWLKVNMKPNINWRIFEAENLLSCSLFLSFLEPAADWQVQAVRVLNDAFYRQIHPDGVHIECNPLYHGGVVAAFLRAYRVARQRPDLGLAMTLEKLTTMVDFSLACTKPNGYVCGIHDSQSEFTGHLRDGRHTEGHKAVDKTAEWEAFRNEFDLGLAPPATSQVYPDAGLAFLRTAWDEDALWMSFDATTWGSGHCHLSRNALQLHAHRQSMVIDPGWLAYSDKEWGRCARITQAHSTCSLGGKDQVSINPRTFRHYEAPGYDALFSVYDGGYWDTELAWTFTHADRAIWGEHARLVFRVGDRFVFVADSMLRVPHDSDDPAEQRPSFDCVWALAPHAKIRLDEERHRAEAQWAEAGLLLLTPIRPDNAVFSVHEGERSPLRGWTPGDGEHVPAPQVVVHTPRMENQHDYCVSALVPYAGSEAPEVEVEAVSPMGKTGHLRLRWADGSTDTIYWGCNLNLMLGAVDGIDTDSSLVHLRRNAGGEVLEGCVVNGTYCDPFSTEQRTQPETFLIGPA
jgi:hypothetical protein